MAAAYQVYILRNPDCRFYIGLSEDLTRRVEQHNFGLSKWTRGKGPWKLIWQSEPMNLSNARKLELLLKSQKRGEGLYRLTGLSRSGS